MVDVKGLTNLIWVWDVQDLDFNWAPYNPGDGYWDVLALDVYGGDGYTLQKYQTLLQLAGNKPIAIGECEVLPTADELAAQPRWTFFMAWAELVSTGNSVQQIQALYNARCRAGVDCPSRWCLWDFLPISDRKLDVLRIKGRHAARKEVKPTVKQIPTCVAMT